MYNKCLLCPDLGAACRGPRLSEMTSAQVKAFLIALKKQRGWTNQYIADRTNTPITTVNRIFSVSDTTDFRHDTVRPIFILFVGGADEDPICGDHHELHERIRALSAENAALAASCQRLQNERSAELAEAKAEVQVKVDYLKAELADVRAQSRRRRRISTACVTGVITLLLLISGFLLIDRLNPTWGIFWREDKPSVFGTTSENPADSTDPQS